MRKLYYIGTKENETIETSHFEEKTNLENNGYKFTVELREEKKEETEEERQKRFELIDKRDKKRKERR